MKYNCIREAKMNAIGMLPGGYGETGTMMISGCLSKAQPMGEEYKKYLRKPELERIIDSIPDVIGIQGHEHTVICYNQAGYALLQKDHSEVSGRKCYELIGRDKPCEKCATSEAYQTKSPAQTKKYIDFFGMWFDVRAYPVLDEKGNIQYVVEHLRNITHEKHVEDELNKNCEELERRVEERTMELCEVNSLLKEENIIRKKAEMIAIENEKKYFNLFNNSLNGFALHQIVTDEESKPVDYIFLDVNPAFEKMTGLKAVDVIGKRATDVIPGIEETDFIDIYGKVALKMEPVRFTKYSAPLKKHFDISAFSPKKGQFAVTFSDITEIKEAEKLLLDAKRIAEKVNDTKSEFFAGISHELRTPLNSIIGFSELILTREYGELTPEQERFILNVLTSGKNLLELINDILDLSKIESGKMCIYYENFSVEQAIDETKISVYPLALKKNIDLTTVIDPDIGNVWADHVKFNHILLNLLSNAIKFTPGGGNITVTGRVKDDELLISVQDSGIGIAESEKQKLFKSFVQLNSQGKRPKEGTGLGLALVKEFVQMQGGRVWVESEIGKGSTFTFTLPLLQ